MALLSSASVETLPRRRWQTSTSVVIVRRFAYQTPVETYRSSVTTNC